MYHNDSEASVIVSGRVDQLELLFHTILDTIRVPF